MTQYLLSVYMIDGQEPPSDEETQKMYADVDAVNEEIKAARAPGCSPAAFTRLDRHGRA